MNEQAILDSYNIFVQNGYSKSLEDYKALLSSNEEALSDSYELFAQQGYSKSIEEYKNLMGLTKLQAPPPVKKKDDIMGSSSEGGSLAPSKALPKFVEEQITTITPSLIGQEEEIVVPKLNYQFGPLGFKFEQSGAGDYMKVTSPSGKTISLSLDPFTSAKEASESTKLQSFIRENSLAIPKIESFEKEYTAANRRYANDKDVDDAVKRSTLELNNFREKTSSIVGRKQQLENEGREIYNAPQSTKNTPQFKDRVLKFQESQRQYNLDVENALKDEQNIIADTERMQSSIGKYVGMKENQGTWYNYLYNKLLTGTGRFASQAQSTITDLMASALPDAVLMDKSEWKKGYLELAKERGIPGPKNITQASYDSWFNSLDESLKDEMHDKLVDKVKKQQKFSEVEGTGKTQQEVIRGFLVDKLGATVAKEYVSRLDQGLFSGAVGGVMESIPSFIGGGGGVKGAASRIVRLISQSEDYLMEEMANDPNFKDVSENEKRLITTPVAITTAVLENIGFRNIIANKGLLNKLTMSALGRAGATTTAKTFGDLVRNDIKSGLARGALTIVGGALAEAETGAAQQAAELAAKDIYNLVKNKRSEDGKYLEMFNTPDSVLGYVGEIAKAGLQEAIGGFVLGVPSAASAAYRGPGFEAMSDQDFEALETMANDTRIEKAYVTNLKSKVSSGDLTTAEAKQMLNDYRNSIGLLNSLPGGLSVSGKKKAMNLLREKRDLERQIDGKDEALSQPQRDRVSEINKELTKLSQDALAERETEGEVIPQEISSLNDDEKVSFNVKSITDIPEQFRDRAVKKEGMQVEMREKILGLPIGKKTTATIGDGYTYSITGKEAKDYAIQEQAAGEVSVQSTTGVSEPVAQGEPQAEPEGVTTESIQEVISPEKQKRKEELTLALENKNIEDGTVTIGDETLTIEDAQNELSSLEPVSLKTQELGFDQVIDLDVNEGDNLKIILNVLDKVDNDISQRLRSGANEAMLALPLSTLQIVVKAIKVLVKGGMALRNAIQKVAIDNNLTESQISDVLNKTIKEPLYSDLSVEGTGVKLSGNEDIKKGDNAPTITTNKGYNEDYTESDILDTEHAPSSRVITHAANIASGKIFYTKDGEKITFQLPYVNKTALRKINSIRKKYKEIKKSTKEAKAEKLKLKDELNKVAQQVLKDFTDVMTQNLLALYDTLTPAFIANSKNWYIGANRMANAIAQKYNLTTEQVSGIMAVLSPQNDWFNNVSVAERVINIMTKYGDTKLTKDVVEKAVAYNSKTGEPNNFANDLVELFSQYGEVSINELNNLGLSVLTQSAVLRAFDQALNSPKVAMTDPQGLFVGFDKTPVRWNSEAEISKAIGIFRNGDITNINKNLGDGNKVRNFYNNIADPNSETPYVTADTHALSAALNGPISANDAGGFGLFNGKLEPAYALVKSAYIKASKIAGIMPREMQSITWEAQRIGINDKNRTEKNKQETFDYIEQSRTNEKTAYERATELIGNNRSADPEWGKSRGITTQKTSDEIREGAELRSKQRVSSISNLRRGATEQLGEPDTKLDRGVAGGGPFSQVIDLNVNEKDNLKKVLDLLNDIDNKINSRLFGGANEALLALPLSTVQIIVKAVKLLVKGGMALRDAIKKAAADNNVTEEQVVNSIETIAKLLDQQGKPQGVSEMELPGYNRMIRQLDRVVRESIERGNTAETTMQNALEYLQGSRVYGSASDTQREQMVRDVRKSFGKREKSAPKPEKLFGEIKDVKMITMSEYELLKKQLSDKARGAKDAIQVWRAASNALGKHLRSMVKGRFITTKQAAVVLRKFSSVNMLDEKSISRFVDYMERVFKNSEYAEQIAQVRGSLSIAKKNTDTKIGIAEGLKPSLKRIFSINPTLIPESVFEKYVALVTMMGQRKTVLELNDINDTTLQAEEILDAIEEELSIVEELAERFNSSPDILMDEDGKIDYAGTIKNMLSKGEITEKEAALMRKYKAEILPAVKQGEKSESEIQAEKDALIQIARSMDVNYERLPTQDERNLARALKKAISTDGVDGLDATTLKNLIRAIDNINNGYLPHFVELLVERISAINSSKILSESVKKAKPLSISALYSKMKSILTKNKNAFSELIRRNPLSYIDQVFGDFKTKNIFLSILEGPSEAQSQFKKAVIDLRNKLDEAENKVALSFKLNPNKLVASKFKMMTYMLQLEYQSNPDSNKVNTAESYLKKTIAHINAGRSTFSRRDSKVLQEIYDSFVVNNEVDNNKLYESFNDAEKAAIKTIQKINEELRDKAIYTAAIIRGDKINPLNDYVHHNTLHEHRPDEDALGTEFSNRFNDSIRPSTKAKSLIERTGGVTALNFDVFASASRGAKYVLMDYYLTPPIRTSRKTLNETKKLLDRDNASDKQIDIFNAINNAFEESVTNLLTENFTATSIGEDAINYISRQGYRAILASVPRFVGELTSNASFAIIAFPNDFIVGSKMMKAFTSSIGPNVMTNVKSKQIARIYPKDTLSGRLIDQSIMEQASGVKGGRSQSDVKNKMQQIYNLSLKKYLNFVETTADALISTPDKIVMRSVWFGAFSNEFKKETGKELDFEKVSNNDEAYMAQNKEALDKARDVSDDKAVFTGAADNAFMGILKGTNKQNQSGFIKAFNMFNNFMSRFLIYEYVTARTGIYAMVGNGMISKRQGAALLGAVATRMTLYTLVTGTLSNALTGLFFADEDEDDEKSLLQKIGQSMTSAFTGLFIGRDFGNATKALINYGVEMFNEKYLDFLREGDYDPYKDALQYTIIPSSKGKKRVSFGDMLLNMMGPFTPMMKTSEMIFKNATAAPKKEADAIERAKKETQIRIPFEILGNLGMIPLYKDIRKIVNAQIYKDIDNAEKKKPMNKMGKEDMKKYAPDLYKELYEPGGAYYEIENIKAELRKEKERVKKQMNDELYNYVPK